MSELPRLIEADDDFQRELIRSAESDRPSARALERTLMGLGVGLTALPAAAVPSAAAGTKLGAALLTKWLLSGLALGMVVTGGAGLSHRLLAPSPRHEGTSAGGTTAPPAPLRATDQGSHPRDTALPPPEPGAPAADTLAPTPVVRRTNDAPKRSGEQPAQTLPAPTSGSAERAFAVDPTPPLATLERETSLLDAARRALARGGATDALAALAGYERAFPQGALRPEASVLKVRALLGAGDRAGAEALGRRVIAAAPGSEHADAIRAALGQRTNP